MLFKKSKYSTLFFVIVLLVINIVIYHQWISFDIFLYGDWYYAFQNSIKDSAHLYIWDSFKGCGCNSLVLFRAPIDMLAGILANAFSFQVIEKFLYFFPVIFLLPITSFYFVREIIKSDIGAFVGSVVISFNTYYISINTMGHILITVATVFSLMSMTYFFKYFTDRKLFQLLLSVLFLTIAGFYDFRISYIIVWVYTLYVCFFLSFSSLLSNGKRLLIVVFLFILLNLFWIIILIQTGEIVSTEILNRSLFGDYFWSLTHAIALHYPFWTGITTEWFVEHPVPFFYYYIPSVAFMGFWFVRNERFAIFWASIAVVGIFLTKQSDAPFGGIYPWMYNNFPGFNAFREATKFYLLIILPYAVFMGVFVEILIKTHIQHFSKIIKIVLISSVVGIFIWNGKSIFTQEIQTLFVKKYIPYDYKLLKDYLVNDSSLSRILWVPTMAKWKFHSVIHPVVSLRTMSKEVWMSIVANDTTIDLVDKQKMIDVLFFNFSDLIMDTTLIKYVIVPISDRDNNLNIYKFFEDVNDVVNIRQWYIDELDKLDYLEKIDIGTKELVVYENKDYKPYIRALDNLMRFENTQNLENKFLFVNDVLGNEFDFIIGDKNDNNINSVNVKDIFENVERKNLGKSTLVINDLINNNSILYARKNEDNVIKIENNKLEILNTPSNEIIKNIDDTLNDKSRFIKTSLASLGDSYSVEYKNDQYNFNNLITNSSFEDGLWSEKVGDCNNNGSSAVLGMIQSNKASDGSNSLELQATQHIACTSQNNILVEEGERYLLAFDYQSDNAEKAGYYIGFDDENKTKISEKLPINNNSWQQFKKQIKIPIGATKASLYVYSYASDGKENIITRYDNFYLTKLPDVMDRYYVVNKPVREFVKPKSVEFDLINPTKKIVHIKGATTPFYLTMSESYHDKWQAQLNNKKVNGFFKKWVPFVHPDSIQNEQHFKYMTFLNGWYVDLHELCQTETGELQDGCVKNLDGSYNIEMVIEFTPQRWFYLGLLISGVTFFSLIGYLGYDFVLRRKKVKEIEP